MNKLIGRAMSDERRVTATEPAIRGNIPSAGGVSVGYQSVPATIDDNVVSFNTGSPSFIRKRRINSITKMPTDEIDIIMIAGVRSFFIGITNPFLRIYSLENQARIRLPGTGEFLLCLFMINEEAQNLLLRLFFVRHR